MYTFKIAYNLCLTFLVHFPHKKFSKLSYDKLRISNDGINYPDVIKSLLSGLEEIRNSLKPRNHWYLCRIYCVPHIGVCHDF